MTVTIADTLRRAPFQLYGLDSHFDGPRFVRSWEIGADDLPTMISLAHGTPANHTSDAPLIEVGVRREDPSIDILDTLTEGLIASAYFVKHGPFDTWRSEALRTIDDWAPTTLLVAGNGHSFRRRKLANDWAAITQIGTSWLYVHAREKPETDVRLEPVDVEAYLTGSER